MSGIVRYSTLGPFSDCLIEDKRGGLVLTSDHLAAIAKLQERVRVLEDMARACGVQEFVGKVKEIQAILASCGNSEDDGVVRERLQVACEALAALLPK